jgi:predicted dehydrogenase
VLDDPKVDAVVIATPDHWHAIQFIAACHASKDVYVEKPMSLTVAEGRRMVETARRTGRVVQVGTQRRSSAMLRDAAEIIRSGGIGRVTMARACDNLNESPNGIGHPADEPPPAGFDWNAWLGPAPYVPYNCNRTWYNYRWFYDYSCGQVTNNGIHLLDVVRWALGVTAPSKVAAMGGHYVVADNREIPDTLEAIWEFDGPTLATFTQLNGNEAPSNAQGADLEFRGTKGTLYVHADRVEIVPEPNAAGLRYRISAADRPKNRAAWMKERKPATTPRVVRGLALADREHMRNFLECVRSRAACNADAETGHLSTTTCILASIALRTGELLEWNAAEERFTNSHRANSLLHYEYRKPHTLG